MAGEFRTFTVSGGELCVPESWLYIWVSQESGQVVYVGATRLDPEVRTWMHLKDESSQGGKIRDRYPQVATEPMEIMAFAVPDDVDRAAAKELLVRRFLSAGVLAGNHICDDPIDAIVTQQVEKFIRSVLAELRAN